MGMHRLFASMLAVSAGVVGCRNDSVPYIGPRDSSAVGTYELAFCRRSCTLEDSAASVVRGFLVLDSMRIVVPDSQAQYFAYADAGKEQRTDPRHAGCFALHEPGRQPVTLSGAPIVHNAFYAVGRNTWHYSPDSTGLVFDLYESIDASFGVEAQLSGGRLVGIASADGMLEGADDGIRHVVGKRIGAPQPARCFAAAPAHWTLKYEVNPPPNKRLKLPARPN